MGWISQRQAFKPIRVGLPDDSQHVPAWLLYRARAEAAALTVGWFSLLTGIDRSDGSLLAFCAMCHAAGLKGTSETSRFAVADPHAFGGFSWLLALLISLAVGAIAGYLHRDAVG
jgi:ribose/xylose/arabinose/galactoside ABC-type transport system permease subunit